MSHRFHSAERLKSRKEIGRLFTAGTATLSAYPVRLLYGPVLEPRGDFPYRAAFVVPKRKFRRAVDRNLLKRRMREAYRLNRSLLTRGAGTQVRGDAQAPGDAQATQYALLFIYTGKEAMPFRYVERKMRKVLGQLAERRARGERR